MPDNESFMVDLLYRYLKEGLAGQEQSVFKRWLASSEANRQLLRRVMSKKQLKRQLLKYHGVDPGAAYLRLQQRHPELRIDTELDRMNVAGQRAGGQAEGMMQRAGDGRRLGMGETAGMPGKAMSGTAGMRRKAMKAMSGTAGMRRKAMKAMSGAAGMPGKTMKAMSEIAGMPGRAMKVMSETAGILRRRMQTVWETVRGIRSWIGSRWQLAGFVLGAGIFLYLGTYLVQVYRRLKLEGNLSLRHAQYTPAGHFAALLLADGSNYELASASAGNLQELGCVVFSKSSDSSMNMTLIPGCSNKHSETYPPVRQPASNTLSTRNGGYFSASLLDGTKVRLNAASSLHFPTMFAKTKREVFLEGEGFFEVAPAAMNDNVPFVVHVFVHPNRDVESGRADVLADTLTIVSLGTRFDIEAYPGEGGIRTRLQEGGLLLKTGDQQLSLSAGQTAILDDKGRLKLDNRTPADSNYWEKGQFLFVEKPATQILDELSRWYDVRFVYRVKKPQEPFTLKGFNRSAPLKDLLDELESMSDLHFQKSGDTVVYVLR